MHRSLSDNPGFTGHAHKRQTPPEPSQGKLKEAKSSRSHHCASGSSAHSTTAALAALVPPSSDGAADSAIDLCKEEHDAASLSTDVDTPAGALKPGHTFGDGGEWTVTAYLASGTWASVYSVRSTDGSEAALKLMNDGANIRSELNGFRRVQDPKSTSKPLGGFPQLLDPPYSLLQNAGQRRRAEKQSYVVLSLLGPSLARCPPPKDAATVGLLGIRLLQALRRLHDKPFHLTGLVYVDIKPDNVCWDLRAPTDPSQVCFVDLELISPRAGIRSMATLSKGTPLFASSNYVKGGVYSRRDDLEALGLLLAHFLGFQFPWAVLPYDPDKKKTVAAFEVEIPPWPLSPPCPFRPPPPGTHTQQ